METTIFTLISRLRKLTSCEESAGAATASDSNGVSAAEGDPFILPLPAGFSCKQYKQLLLNLHDVYWL